MKIKMNSKALLKMDLKQGMVNISIFMETHLMACINQEKEMEMDKYNMKMVLY